MEEFEKIITAILLRSTKIVNQRLSDTVGGMFNFSFDINGFVLNSTAITVNAIYNQLYHKIGSQNAYDMLMGIVAYAETEVWTYKDEKSFLNNMKKFNHEQYVKFMLKSISKEVKNQFIKSYIDSMLVPKEYGELSQLHYISKKFIDMNRAFFEYCQENVDNLKYRNNLEKLLDDSAEQVDKIFLKDIGFVANVEATTNKPKIYKWLIYYVQGKLEGYL